LTQHLKLTPAYFLLNQGVASNPSQMTRILHAREKCASVPTWVGVSFAAKDFRRGKD
jgi:hypothetical protein